MPGTCYEMFRWAHEPEFDIVNSHRSRNLCYKQLKVSGFPTRSLTVRTASDEELRTINDRSKSRRYGVK